MVGPTKMSRTTGTSTNKQNGGSSLHHCDVCGKDFPFKVVLDMHKKDHVFKNHYKCDVCESAYPKKSMLEMHYRKHTGERPYKCDECDAAFMNSSNLQRHKRKHVNKRRYDTDEWEAAYTLSDNLSADKKKKNIKRDVIFTEVGLTNMYSCSECNESYSNLNALINHKKKHSAERPFSCEDCGAMFAVRASLDYHKLKHTGGKPVKDTSYWNNNCNICGESFTSKDGLMQHSRKHTGARSLNCDKPLAAFSNCPPERIKERQDPLKLQPTNHILNPQTKMLQQENSYNQPNLLIQQQKQYIPQQQTILHTQVILQQQQQQQHHDPQMPSPQSQMPPPQSQVQTLQPKMQLIQPKMQQIQPQIQLIQPQIQPLKENHQQTMQLSNQHIQTHLKQEKLQQEKQQKFEICTNSESVRTSNLDLHELQPPVNLFTFCNSQGVQLSNSHVTQLSDVNGLPGPMGPQAQPVVSEVEARGVKLEPL